MTRCKIGITSDLETRAKQWRSENPQFTLEFNILEVNLTYDQAIIREEELAKIHGCDFDSGGRPTKENKSYLVYKMSW